MEILQKINDYIIKQFTKKYKQPEIKNTDELKKHNDLINKQKIEAIRNIFINKDFREIEEEIFLSEIDKIQNEIIYCADVNNLQFLRGKLAQAKYALDRLYQLAYIPITQEKKEQGIQKFADTFTAGVIEEMKHRRNKK